MLDHFLEIFLIRKQASKSIRKLRQTSLTIHSCERHTEIEEIDIGESTAAQGVNEN